jgi:hypothetical protein
MVDTREAIALARHDLGKYIALQTRWLPEDPATEELRAALLSDLRRTRSGGGVEESAVEVWRRVRPALEGLNLEALDQRMDEVEHALPRITEMGHGELVALSQAALQVGVLLKKLG